MATQSEEAARVRRFVEQMRSAIDPAAEHVEELAAWFDRVQKQADALDPLISGAQFIMSEVQRVGPYD